MTKEKRNLVTFEGKPINNHISEKVSGLVENSQLICFLIGLRIYKIDQITLYPCFTLIPRTGMGPPKKGLTLVFTVRAESIKKR